VRFLSYFNRYHKFRLNRPILVFEILEIKILTVLSKKERYKKSSLVSSLSHPHLILIPMNNLSTLTVEMKGLNRVSAYQKQESRTADHPLRIIMEVR